VITDIIFFITILLFSCGLSLITFLISSAGEETTLAKAGLPADNEEKSE
jgi:hypothetical protein